jgi:beta-fructofuranosidase
MKDDRPWQAIGKSGWSGMFSLPRQLWLGKDGMLRMGAPSELETLRYNPVKIDPMSIDSDSERWVKKIRGNSLELMLEFDIRNARQCGVKVCCSDDMREQTSIYYDAREKKLCIDTRRSSLGFGSKLIEGGPLALKRGEHLKLRVFVDKSIIEVYANDRQGVTRQIFPTLSDSVNVSLFANGGSAKVRLMQAWEMMPSNPY